MTRAQYILEMSNEYGKKYPGSGNQVRPWGKASHDGYGSETQKKSAEKQHKRLIGQKMAQTRERKNYYRAQRGLPPLKDKRKDSDD
jgi:uncharacterized protein YkwD